MHRSIVLFAFLVMCSIEVRIASAQCSNPCIPLWNLRWFACDFGSSNFGCLNRDGTPVCGTGNCPWPGACWGPINTLASMSSGPVQWSTGIKGELDVSVIAKDYQVYGDTWIYSITAQTLVSPFSANVGCVWCNGTNVGAGSGVATLSLVQGWNHIEWTAYSQNSNAFIKLLFPFTDHVSSMTANPASKPLCEPGSAIVYGCGINRSGSIFVTGEASLGQQLTIWVHNPLATQSIPSLPSLILSTQAFPSYPCGVVLAGLGMAGPGSPGELLVQVGPTSTIFAGFLWLGQPAPFSFGIPNDPCLLGQVAYLQGVIRDPNPTSNVPIGLTDAVKVSVGF